MSGVPSLVVPVGVEALCVGTATDPAKVHFVGATADFSELPRWDDASGLWTGKPYIGESITSFPRPTLQSGVHLHWALPDALTHGGTDAQGRLRFPPVPNRWLVVRLRAGKQATAAKAWVVESDYLDTDSSKASVSVPFRRDGSDQYYRYLGRAVPLEQWSETAAGNASFKALTGEPLTAVGYGEATFAAFYPNCRNVFGFHDRLDDITDLDAGGAALSYLVTGWFSDPSLDPLAGGALAAKDNAMRWSFTERPDEKPARAICSGLVRGIRWDAKADYFPATSNPVDIAVGNTTVECVSALLASRPDLADDPDAEFILDAVQSGLLGDEWHPDQLVKIEEAIHGSAFASVPGGGLWQIKPPRSAAPGAPPPAELPGPPVTLSIELSAKLAALNELQRSYDRLQSEGQSRRQALFLDWYRFMRLLHGADDRSIDAALPALATPQARGDFIDGLREFLQDQQDALDALEGTRGALTLPGDGSARVSLAGDSPPTSVAARLKTALAELDAAVAAESKGALVLQQGIGPRYWEATEPVMLLSGEDIRPPARYGGDGDHSDTGELPCRLWSEILQALTAGPATAKREIGASDFLPAIALDRLPCPAEAGALLAEAILTDPACAELLAARVLAKGGPAVTAPETLADEIGKLQAAIAAGGTAQGQLAVPGKAPSKAGITDWKANPWLPLFLQWELQYQAVATPEADDKNFPADAITQRYALDDDRIDLVHRGAVPARAQSLRGVTLLTQNAFTRLKDSIGKLLATVPDAKLQAIADKISTLPMLSQVFNGFNQTLMTRKRAIQLEVFDPVSTKEKSLFAGLREAIAEHNDAAPLPLDPFHGIRAGFLRIDSLTLIDVFGRLKPIDLAAARLARARSLVPTDPALKANKFIHLPPRLAQPARLNFRLLDAGGGGTETNSHAASSPICGWVLVNNFDPGLAIYDADGASLGMLRLIGGGAETAWQPAPVAGSAIVEADDHAGMQRLIKERIANRHLADFVLGVLDHPDRGRFLESLLLVVDKTLATIVPDRSNPDQSLGLLIGRPLALARVSLSLEIKGLPAFSTSWPSLDRDIKVGADATPGGPPAGTVRDTRDFTKVAFGVKLGDLRQIDDGLIGYFLERNGDARDFLRFFAPAAETTTGSVATPSADPILLTAAPDAPPLQVSLLMDPHAAVHASTGILPVKSIDIPSDHYAQALAKLRVAFLCNPLLASAGGMRIPLPAIPGFGWSWIEPGPANWTAAGNVGGAGERPQTSYSPQRIVEGWLQLDPDAAGKPRS